MGCCNARVASATQDKYGVWRLQNQELLDTIQFLRSTPIFRTLQQEDFPVLARASARQSYAKEEEVVRCGEQGVDFYVVLKGKASAWRPRGGARGSCMRASQQERGSRNSGSSDGSTSRCRGRLSQIDIMAATEHKPEKIATYREKDYFGEEALLLEEVWPITVLAESDLQCIKVPQAKVQELGLTTKLQIPKRKGVVRRRLSSRNSDLEGRDSGVGIRSSQLDSDENLFVAKTAEERAFLGSALLRCEALQVVLGDHGEELLDALCDIATKEELSCRGEVVINPELSPTGAVYVVQRGGLRVRPLEAEEKEAMLERAAGCQGGVGFSPDMAALLDEVERELASVDSEGPGPTGLGKRQDWSVGVGELYGELTLLYDTPHCALVEASEQDTLLWRIDQRGYELAMRQAARRRIEEVADLLVDVDAFGIYVSDERRKVASCFKEKHFPQNHVIYKEGDEKHQTFYLLLEGEVSLASQELGEIGRLRGHRNSEAASEVRHFGAGALAPIAKASTVTVRVTSLGGCKCSCLFREVISAMPELSLLLQGLASRQRDTCFQVATRVDTESLEKIAKLGAGAFGMVELFRDPKTKELYAIKTMGKARIARSEVLKAQVINEKYILEICSDPGSQFITKLFQTSQTKSEIQFVLEPCLGGELYAACWQNRLFGKEECARFYSASVALGLEYLHERFIAYRDLKPENAILDAKGRLKLTDMGLAKFVADRTYTTCGTASYYAPEMVKQGGYTVAVDWWQLGIFAWELLVGKTPFVANSLGEALFKLITQEALADLEDPLREWPKNIAAASAGAKAFLICMLSYDPEKRAPMQEEGAVKMRALEWFQGTECGAFDWHALEQGTLAAPFLPQSADFTTGKTPTNFNSMVRNFEFEEYIDDGTGWDGIF